MSREIDTQEEVIHHFERGAFAPYKIEVHLPRELKQFSSIEQALEEGYIPLQVRVWPIGHSRWTPIDPVRESNTCKGFSAILELGELDITHGADAYVPSVMGYDDVDVTKQMLVNFLYFKKPCQKGENVLVEKGVEIRNFEDPSVPN